MSTHVVKRGETLGRIASLHHTTVRELIELNGISNPNLIQVGQTLRLPIRTSDVLDSKNISEKVKTYINFLEGKMLKRILSPEQRSNINLIFQTCLQLDVVDLRQIAYVLATTQWETARTFMPVEEFGKGRNKSYGVPHPKTGKIYFGRGFVQLTWYDNYARFTRLLRNLGHNVDLINNPEEAQQPQISAIILVLGMRDGLYTGRRLSDYINEEREDYFNARRIVNGTDKAVIIKDIALQTHYIIK